ncbi:2-hydroxycarboxylate transporter family protein [Rhodococcoides kroppenstedtii]|uniref:2-hydroxycarboxylate transporter family protein n=1 Tax=Rhodococcoides kroppenstedtii TaxID=293050 RepID=UPI00363AD5E9
MTTARESEAESESPDGPPASGRDMTTSLGLPYTWFVPAAAVVMVIAYLVTPSAGMTAGFAITMAAGGLLMIVGNAIPGLNRIGGGVILAILAPAVLYAYGLMPEHTATAISDFYSLSSFGEFVVAALIVGSILGMNRSLLIRAGSRIIVPILATLLLCFSLFALIGWVTGYGVGTMLFFVVGPVLGGGVAAGAIPISELIAQNSGGDSADYLSQLVPAVVVANVVCIAVAAMLAWFGRKRPDFFRNFNGRGQLAVTDKALPVPIARKVAPADAVHSTVVGLFAAGALFMVADLIASVVPSVHTYVFLILLCAVLKVFVPLPESIVQAADLWYRLVAAAFIPAILVSVSIVAIDFQEVITLVHDPIYMISTVAVVLVAALAAGITGWLIKLNFIESSISGGLGLADFGSSGDLAVLGAANRLELLPFLSISSRIGGGLVVLILSLLGPFVL